jgi:HSP20 family protein
MLIHPAAPRRVARHPASAPVPSVFDELWRGVGGVPATAPAGFVPPVDAVESNTDMVLTAELPGVRQGDFEVIVESDVVTLRGEKKLERPEGGSRRCERAAGRFSRTFRLPFEVDPDAVKAALADGLLTVTVPKPAEKQVRTVPITSA